MAFILIDKITDEHIVAIDKITVAHLCGVHRHTITNWLIKKGNRFETDKYKIIKVIKYYPTVKSSGNRLTNSERERNKAKLDEEY